jgi:hypothetical protein
VFAVPSKALVAIAIVVAGGVAAFAVYSFAWRDSNDTRETTTVTRRPSITTETGRHPLYTVHPWDVVFDPATRTQCEVTHEAGIPNLFCTYRGPRSRYQVVFWKDSVDVYDLAAPGEPMVATYSVPAQLKHGQRYAPR